MRLAWRSVAKSNDLIARLYRDPVRMHAHHLFDRSGSIAQRLRKREANNPRSDRACMPAWPDVITNLTTLMVNTLILTDYRRHLFGG